MTGATVDIRNPFPGLRPFEEEENHLFFGRDAQTAELLMRLHGNRFLAVVGASGSGKSSLVKAGLLPSLHGGFMAGAGSRWRVVQLRPGGDPIGNLAAALYHQLGAVDPGHEDIDVALTESALKRSPAGLANVVQESIETPNTNVLVLVDQFEELFRYQRRFRKRSGVDRRRSSRPADQDTRTGLDRRLGLERPLYDDRAAEFVKLLLEASRQTAAPIYVVITMRSDFLGDCARFRDLPEAINDAQYLVPRLTRDQRREVITGPAAIGGARLDQRLLQRLLNDVGENPDQLPILQHALMRTWQRWELDGDTDQPLRLEHYQRIGGWDEALSRHANEALDSLPERLQEVARKLFTCLTERDPQGRVVRRPTSVADICAITGADLEDVVEVVEAFRASERSFLRTDDTISTSSVIDISHESLSRNWDRIKLWAEAEAESAAMYRRLAEAATQYFGVEQEDPGSLLRGHRLALALQWSEENRPTAEWAARYGSGAGLQQALEFLGRSRVAEETRIREQREAEERERQRERELAQKEQERLEALAEKRRTEAQAAEEKARLQAESLRKTRRLNLLIMALLVSVAVFAVDSFLARQKAVERGVVAANHSTRQGLELLAAVEPNIAVANFLLSANLHPGGPGTAAMENLLRWLRWPVIASEVRLAEAARVVAAGANMVVIASGDSLRSLDAATGDLVAAWRHDAAVRGAAIGSQGSLLATAGGDGVARLWDLAGGRLIDSTAGHGELLAVALSPNEQLVAFGGSQDTVWLWDRETGDVRQISRHQGWVVSVAFDPAGTRILSASGDGTAQITSVTGSWTRSFPHDAAVTSAQFDNSGTRIVTASMDWIARVWDATTGDTLGELSHPGGVFSARFSPDGSLIVTRSNDEIARLWPGDSTEPILLRHRDLVTSARFSPDGSMVITASQDGTARLWSRDGQQTTAAMVNANDLTAAVLSADNGHATTGSTDGTVRTWHIPAIPAGGAVRLDRDADELAVSGDGGFVITGSDEGSVFIWDARSGKVIDSLRHPSSVRAVTWSKQGAVAASADDNLVWLWAGGGVTDSAALDSGRVRDLALEPAGRAVAVAAGNSARVRDLDEDRWFLLPHEGSVGSVQFSPDGRRVVTRSGSSAFVWLWREEKLEAELPHDDNVRSARFSNSGREVITASADQTARRWVVGPGDDPRTPTGEAIRHTHDIRWAEYSPDDRWIVTASHDGTARVWDSKSGQAVSDRMAHPDRVDLAVFDPRGVFVATVARDGGVRVWDAATGVLVGHAAHPTRVSAVAFTGNGSIVTVDNQGDARVWPVYLGKASSQEAADEGVWLIGGSVGSAELAAAVAGYQINDYGSLVETPGRFDYQTTFERRNCQGAPSLECRLLDGVPTR